MLTLVESCPPSAAASIACTASTSSSAPASAAASAGELPCCRLGTPASSAASCACLALVASSHGSDWHPWLATGTGSHCAALARRMPAAAAVGLLASRLSARQVTLRREAARPAPPPAQLSRCSSVAKALGACAWQPTPVVAQAEGAAAGSIAATAQPAVQGTHCASHSSHLGPGCCRRIGWQGLGGHVAEPKGGQRRQCAKLLGVH